MRFIITALALAGVLLTGACTVPQEVSTEAGSPPASAAQGGGGEAEPEGDGVTRVGTWAKAEDGIAFRVSKLTRAKVPAYAAGGTPGDPAVVATVQIRNGSKKRFDMTLVEVQARLGSDGDQSEQVFADSYGNGFMAGTLAPGRTASAKFMFAASSAKDLKKVSIEVTPGMLDYEPFSFEGSAA